MHLMDLGLSGRTYVVTGASSGLGRAVVGQLILEDANVVICSRDAGTLDEVVREAPSGRVLAIAGDLSDADLPTRLTAAALARFGRLDGALVSVGGPPIGTVEAVSDDQWRSSFETVFLGPLRVARAVVDAASVEGASLVFVLSTSVKAPVPGLATSNGLRPGLAMVAKELADEVGPRGIRVNAVLPGRIDTARVRELDEAGGRGSAVRREMEASIPLRRYGDPEEFARVATFVLSPVASYLTGTAIPVDGGMTRPL